MKKLSKKWWIILIVIIFVLIAVIVGWYISSKKDSSSTSASGKSSGSSNKLVSCTNSSNAQPAKYHGFNSALVAEPILETSPNYGIKDNSTRTFSIKGITNKNGSATVYYLVESSDGRKVPGTKSVMEICDKNNKSVNYYTTATTNASGASENALGIYQYLHSNRTLPPAGTGYRIDGYLYTDGAWHLTDRMSGIEFTE